MEHQTGCGNSGTYTAIVLITSLGPHPCTETCSGQPGRLMGDSKAHQFFRHQELCLTKLYILTVLCLPERGACSYTFLLNMRPL